MGDNIVMDISADGEVSIVGFPAADAEHWNLLARGLTGYFKTHGLLGPEKAHERLDAIHQLLDQYGIDKTNVHAGIVQ